MEAVAVWLVVGSGVKIGGFALGTSLPDYQWTLADVGKARENVISGTC